MEKLKDLCERDVDDFLKSGAERDSWRYHEIDWNQQNCPIDRSKLNWLDRDILTNADEFPLYQFQISKSLGRVVGYWDVEHVFNIVLLDPLHNMQPSKSHGYKVDPCSPLSCDYTLLMGEVVRMADSCASAGCKHRDAIRAIQKKKTFLPEMNVLIIGVADSSLLDAANDLIEHGVVQTHDQIFNAGVNALYAPPPSP